MIKSSEEDGRDTTSPPEIFDSGVGSKNRSGRKGGSPGRAVADSSSGGFATPPMTTVEYNWKYGLCRHKIAFEATETIKRMRFKVLLLHHTMTSR
jgi:hypothetical protein